MKTFPTTLVLAGVAVVMLLLTLTAAISFTSPNPSVVFAEILAALVMVGLGVTLLVLVVGVLGMLRGGAFNKKYGNVMMRARVISQAVTVLLMMVYAFVHG